MSAALRLTLAWFDFLPVQRWLNIIGGGLLALSLLLAIGSGFSEPASLVGGTGKLGVLLILITPVFCCGTALRYISALNTMYLRPNSRTQVLYGATLAITLMAAIAALPVLFEHLNQSISASHAPITRVSAIEVFATAWACGALICIVSFIASASTRASLLIMLTPVVVTQLDLSIRQHLPGVSSGFTIAVMAWIGFAAWYLRARTIRSPGNVQRSGYPRVLSRNTAAAQRPAIAHDAPASRTAALRQYLLGTASPVNLVLPGAVAAVLLLAVLPWLMRESSEAARQIPVVILGLLFWIGAAFGYRIVRRARLLWLRAGVDRGGLFRITERMGMTSGLFFLGPLATGVAAWSLIQRPGPAAHILLGMLPQLSLAPLLFYGFLGFTGSRPLVDRLLLFAMIFWLVIVAAITLPAETLPGTSLKLLAISAVLTWLLRMRALRRWRGLDWRIAQAMPTPMLRR